MPATCVVVHLPSAGTVLGDVVAGHEDARVTSVPTAWHQGPDGEVLDLLALVEGISDADLAGLLLAWNRRYGEPPHVLGESFALLLPVAINEVPPVVQKLLRMDRDLPILGSVAEQDWIEQWFKCQSRAEAEAFASRLRQALGHLPGVEVRVASPRRADLECWEVLHLAGGVDQTVEAPAT